ncbi:MAG: cytochrome c [Desulfuromonadaceae bacterium]|nr:cytochrome c [Desulfuromonadaceae bacterium]
MKRYAIAVIAILIIQGLASAHEGENHTKRHKEYTQMEKLHKIMPMCAQVQVNINEALLKGDAATIKNEAGKILAALPDLKKSRPHKNIEQRKKFVRLATKLEEPVTTTVYLANKGDFAEAKVAFKRVEEACAACHAKFRD